MEKDGEELIDDHNAQIIDKRNIRADAECHQELTKKRRDWKHSERSRKRPANDE